MKNKFESLKFLCLLTQLGLVFLTCIALSMYIGSFIDNFFGDIIFFRILFLILGIISGFIGMYRMIMKATKTKLSNKKSDDNK